MEVETHREVEFLADQAPVLHTERMRVREKFLRVVYNSLYQTDVFIPWFASLRPPSHLEPNLGVIGLTGLWRTRQIKERVTDDPHQNAQLNVITRPVDGLVATQEKTYRRVQAPRYLCQRA